VAVGGVIVATTLLCYLVKKQNKKSTKKSRWVAAVWSSQLDVDEDSCWASTESAQASHDVNITAGSLEEVSLEDDEDEDEDEDDVERGTTLEGSKISDISSCSEWEDSNTTSTENANLRTPGPPRSLFPAGSVAAVLNMAGIAYLKRVGITSGIRKTSSEEAANASDSCSRKSRGPVSENNNDDMSSSTSSVYLEDGDSVNSDSDDSSISSHQDWQDTRSMDNITIWSSPAFHAGDTCEMGEI
jgi:hypothetical protein